MRADPPRPGTGIAHQATDSIAPDFELLFNASPNLYLVLSPSFHIQAVSDRYLDATLTVREQILGQYIFDVFPDDPCEEATGVRNLRASLQYVVANKVADTMAVQRYSIRTSNEAGAPFELRYWSPSNSPVFSKANGRLLYIVHRVEDVTAYIQSIERRSENNGAPKTTPQDLSSVEAEVYVRAQEIQDANRRLKLANAELSRLHELLQTRSLEREEALKVSDERFRILVDGVKEYAIFMLDQRGAVISWNQGAERIYGFSEQEVLGKGYDLFYSPQDRLAGIPQNELAAALSQGSADEQGWRIRRDGSRFWANGVLTALRDEHGEIRGYAKISRDLTKSRRAETLLQSIVDTAIDGIITINAQGIIQTFNRAAEKIFGFSAAEVLGKNINLLMPEPDRSRHGQYISNYLRTGHAQIIGIGREVEGKRKNGEQFPMELAISEFSQEGERAFTGLVRDISARKKLERQYRHAQRMEAVGKLAGGIAHDFNNLLTVILGYSEILKAELAPDKAQRQLVDEIHHAGTRAALLTRQLLTFSRHQTNQPVVASLNSIVSEACRMLSRLIGEDINVVMQLQAQPGCIRADPVQIEQVVLNLSINARDAMPNGGQLTIVTYGVDLSNTSPIEDLLPGRYTVLEVRDTGEGIDPKIQSEIFEPFFTTKCVGKGTGLGLSVVDGIVRQSNAYLRLESKVGAGTTFRIYFPEVAECDVIKEQPPDVRAIRGTEAILLVEDDASVREFTARALTSLGYDVVKAHDVYDALRVVESTPKRFELLLTDVVMPELSGFELVAAIRRVHPSIKWLLVSGYTDEIVAKKHRMDVDVSVLQKPYTVELLATAVQKALAS